MDAEITRMVNRINTYCLAAHGQTMTVESTRDKYQVYVSGNLVNRTSSYADTLTFLDGYWFRSYSAATTVTEELKAEVRELLADHRLVVVDPQGVRAAPDRTIKTEGSILDQSIVAYYDAEGWPREL